MTSAARGWNTPEGRPRYELREALEPEDGFERWRAGDLSLGREILLVRGDERLLERAVRVGRLEHPAIVTVYNVGRDPEGRVFLATLDPTGAVPLSDLLDGMTRDEVLAVVVTVAHAAAHAEERGIVHANLDLEDVLRFPDGEFRIAGWDEPPTGDVWPVRSVQKLLRRAIVPYGPAPRPLWSIVRHEYERTTDLARDLTAYLGGHARLRATELPWRQRVSAWALHHPALATFLGGTVVVAVFLATLIGGLFVLSARREAQAREIEAEARTGRLGAQLDRAEEHLGLLREIAGSRLEVLARRREMYHRIESLRPTREEMVLDAEIASLGSRWTAEARLVRAAAELAATELAASPSAEDQVRLESALRRVEVSHLEYLLAQAEFEEEKTLSTRTIERARATGPLAEALSSGDAKAARAALGELRKFEDHPYLRPAEALVEILERRPSWTEALLPLVARLEIRGALMVVNAPSDAAVWLSEILRDDQGRWIEGESTQIHGGQAVWRPMGVYLVEIYGDGQPVRYEVLLERGEKEEIDAGLVPPSVPGDWVWIPPATFYRGGSEEDVYFPSRYRKARVEKPFLIRRTETTFGEYMAWVKTLDLEDIQIVRLVPGQLLLGTYYLENWQPEWPVQGATHASALKYAEAFSLSGWRTRLPTEEEWELAARGVAGRLYPWGDRYLEERSHSVRRGSGGPESPLPAGRNKEIGDVSIFKVEGLAGNVSEWTSTAFDDASVVAKGAGFNIGEMEAAPARYPMSPREYSFGFRLAGTRR